MNTPLVHTVSMLCQLLCVIGAPTDDVKRLPAQRAVHVDSGLALQGLQDVYELAAGQADVGKLRLHVAGVEGAGHRLPAIQGLCRQIVCADDCDDKCISDAGSQSQQQTSPIMLQAMAVYSLYRRRHCDVRLHMEDCSSVNNCR